MEQQTVNSQTVQLHDKSFDLFIPETRILEAVQRVAEQLNRDYAGKEPYFLAVLNGSFMFASDLLKEVSVPCDISFVKLASYSDMSSTGNVSELIGLQDRLSGRHVVVIEDIVDTGNTMKVLLEQLKQQQPASVEIASLLLKPECLQHALEVKYVALEIANDFVVGYGLDYNGRGRNLRHIYKVL